MARKNVAGQASRQQRCLAVRRDEAQIVQAAVQGTGIAESQYGQRPVGLDAAQQPGLQCWPRWAAEQRQRIARQPRQRRCQYDPIGLFSGRRCRIARQQPDALGAAGGQVQPRRADPDLVAGVQSFGVQLLIPRQHLHLALPAAGPGVVQPQFGAAALGRQLQGGRQQLQRCGRQCQQQCQQDQQRAHQ